MVAPRWAYHAWRHVALATLLWALATATPSYPVAYCAKLNTASIAANYSNYQSEGLCYRYCLNKYALAIMLDKACWCSNYVPSKTSQVSTDKCQNGCPGYPDDYCGGDNLFGYVALNKAPSGTATTGTASSTTVKVTETEPVQPTVHSTVTGPPTSNSATTTSEGTDSESAPTVSTVTADGTIRTVTVVPPVPTNASNSAGMGSSSEEKKGLSTGAAVGVAVGIVAIVLAIAAGILYMFIKRRRQRREEEKEGYDAPSHRGSSSGMMGTPKNGEVSENRYVGGSDGRTMAENWENSSQGKRRSTLMPIDPRMDPFTKGIYHSRPENNKSHESVNSLQDNQDYSRRVHEPTRVLRATNPDPDVD